MAAHSVRRTLCKTTENYLQDMSDGVTTVLDVDVRKRI